jgi:hypothetical protein
MRALLDGYVAYWGTNTVDAAVWLTDLTPGITEDVVGSVNSKELVLLPPLQSPPLSLRTPFELQATQK